MDAGWWRIIDCTTGDFAFGIYCLHYEGTCNIEGVASITGSNEIECKSWAQFFLKYILSFNEITCVIPGTSKHKHLVDNMKAGFGKLPDINMRRKMRRFIMEI